MYGILYVLAESNILPYGWIVFYKKFRTKSPQNLQHYSQAYGKKYYGTVIGFN